MWKKGRGEEDKGGGGVKEAESLKEERSRDFMACGKEE